MALRRSRLILLSAVVLAVVLGAVVLAISWWSRGPGLDAEVGALASVVELRPGMTVADIGAGNGRMAVRVAQRLGPSGRVYATEIEASKLSAIRNAAAAAGIGNLAVLEAGERSTRLPEACCDVIYLRRVYHHLTDAAAINNSLYAALRPGGRLAVIDFLTPRWMFFARHGIPANVVAGQVTSAGFLLERRIERWSPIDYCLVFRKPPARTANPAGENRRTRTWSEAGRFWEASLTSIGRRNSRRWGSDPFLRSTMFRTRRQGG